MELRREILAHAAEGTLLHAIFHDYGRRSFKDDDPTIATLADLHNTAEIDLLALVTPNSIEPYKGNVFFNGQLVYRALISLLQASAEALMNVVQTLHEAAGQDLAAGFPVEEFAKWCSLNPARPAELLALVDAKIPNADRFLTIAIKSGVAVDRTYFMDRAYSFLESGSETEKQASINALGQVALLDDADWDRLLQAFSELLSFNPEDAIRSTLFTAVARRLEGAPESRRDGLTKIGIAAVAQLGDHTLDMAARTLAFHEHLTPELVDAALEALLALNGANKGTIEMLDYAIANLVERGDSDRARRYLEGLLRRDDDRIELEQLDSLCHKLREIGGQTLEDWVVAWLLDGDHELCSALNDAIFGAGSDEFTFEIDFTRFGLRDIDYCYLARKAIATFFIKQTIMASLLVSLLRSAPTPAEEEIIELLIDPILLNYSTISDEYLKPIAEDATDQARTAVGRALAGQESYIEGLRSTGNIPELHPSERERRLELQRHSDSMSEAYRKARQQSVFASIIPESVILYGTRAVTWFADNNEMPRRIETPMASISHSFEVPRIDIVDPLGLQLMLLHFRAEKRPA